MKHFALFSGLHDGTAIPITALPDLHPPYAFLQTALESSLELWFQVVLLVFCWDAVVGDVHLPCLST